MTMSALRKLRWPNVSRKSWGRPSSMLVSGWTLCGSFGRARLKRFENSRGRALDFEMARLGFPRVLNLIFQFGDLVINFRQLGRPFAFRFRRIGPRRQSVKLDLAPSMEENVVLFKNQLQYLARLFCYRPACVGKVPTLAQLLGGNFPGQFAIDINFVISFRQAGNF